MAVDSYTEWLGAPPGPRPPDYYTLLGVDVFCRDMDAIERGARRQLTRLDEFALYPDRDTRDAVQDMMNEVARARVDLVNPKRRPAYDRKLAQRLGVPLPAEPAPAVQAETTIAPPPIEPRSPTEIAPEATAELQPATEEVGSVAAQFEAGVWAHLQKWKLNAHEQRLLLAEAAALGVSSDEALRIIERMDGEAEILAEKKYKQHIRRVFKWSAMAAIVVIFSAVMFAVVTQRLRSVKDRNFADRIEAVRQCLEEDDLRGAEEYLAQARGIFPDDPRLEEAALDAALKRKAVKDLPAILLRARRFMDRGELDQAERELAEARALRPKDLRLKVAVNKLIRKRKAMEKDAFANILSRVRRLVNSGELDQAESELAKISGPSREDPRYVELRGKIRDGSRERELKFRRTVSDTLASLRAGNPNQAAKSLAEAWAILPGDARLAPLRQELVRKWEQKFEQAVSSTSASLKSGDPAAAAKSLSEASAIQPDDARLAPLRRELLVARKQKFEKVVSSTSASLAAWNLDVAAKSLAEAEAMRPGDAALAPLRRKLEARARGELTSLDGHSGKVSSIAFSPDGKRIASGSHDKSVKIWDAGTCREVATLQGHTDKVLCVAFSPDGKRIASGGIDKTVNIRDAATGREITTFKGHTSTVCCVAFSPDGKRIASGGHDNTVMIWDPAITGKAKATTLKGHTNRVSSVVFSPNGRLVISGSWDTTVKIWDAVTGRLVRTFNGHTSYLYSVSLSPDGKRVVSCAGAGAVKIWDAITGMELRVLIEQDVFGVGVDSVAFSPDGKHIVSNNWGGLKIWDAASGRAIRTLKGGKSRVSSVTFSPNGRCIAAGSEDNAVKIWYAGEPGKQPAAPPDPSVKPPLSRRR